MLMNPHDVFGRRGRLSPTRHIAAGIVVCAVALLTYSCGDPEPDDGKSKEEDVGIDPKDATVDEQDVGAADSATRPVLDVSVPDVVSGCTADKNCAPEAPFCNTATGACVVCRHAGHCSTKDARCVGGKCAAPIPCKSDKDCGAVVAVCDAKAGVCVDCLSDADCDAGTTCKANNCMPKPPGCSSSKDCKAFGQVCDKAAGVCAECIGIEDCEDKQHCKDGLCLPAACAKDEAKCVDLKTRATCKADFSGFKDTPCGGDEVCVDGDCLKAICTPAASKCESGNVVKCDALGVSWKPDATCGSDTICIKGACQPKVCEPNTSKCADSGHSKLVCKDDGQGWVDSNCPLKQTCVTTGKTAACKPHICEPATKKCDGNKVLSCKAGGLATEVADDCAKPGADGKARVCKDGACVPQKCEPGAKTCVGAGIYECDAKGLSGVGTPCPKNHGCESSKVKGPECKPLTCKPATTYCTGKVADTCNASGTGASKTLDCPAVGKTCSKGACVDYVCKPGTAKCDASGTKVVTCKPDGLSTDNKPCGSGTVCVAGKCEQVVCSKGLLFCAGQQARKCNESGTASKLVSTCPATKACVAGACVPKVCKKGAFVCDGLFGYKVCKDNGAGWLAKTCPKGSGCSGTACATQICTPGTKRCTGNQLESCHAAGIKWLISADCAKAGKLCSAGACKTQVCKPGAKVCQAGKLASCAKDGLSWIPASCGNGTVCDGGQCKTVLCKAGVKSCDKFKVLACNSLGTVAAVSKDCAKSKQTCENGACRNYVCLPSSVTCVGVDIGTCDGMGLKQAVTNCGAKSTCSSGACVAWNCTPKAAYCLGNKAYRCADTGLKSELVQDCGKTATCVKGACKAQVCKPGAKKCTGGAVSTCAMDGLSWTHKQCQFGTNCDAGACHKVICKPGATFCASNSVKLCAASATKASTVKACGSKHVCVADKDKAACKPKICTSTNYKCKNYKVQLQCSKDQTGWIDAPCYPGYYCDEKDGQCKSKKCEPGQVGCNGFVAWKCSHNGLAKLTVADCAKTTGACKTGKCVAKVCTPGQRKCFGVALGTCTADALNWQMKSCADNNACDMEWCKAGKCGQDPPKKCNDGQICTSDKCDTSTGKCVYTQLTGACDDGTKCTKNERCVSGKCVVETAGDVKAFVGSGSAAFYDHPVGLSARFRDPYGVTFGTDGNLYVVGWTYCNVRQVDMKKASHPVKRVAGRVGCGFKDSTTGTAAYFRNPSDIEATADGGFVVADFSNNRVRRVSKTFAVTTLAGNGNSGYAAGKGQAARIYRPAGVSVAADGSIFVTEYSGHRVRRIAPDTNVTLVAGSISGGYGFVDGKGASARFRIPFGIAVHKNGTAYVSDMGNNAIRRISPDGTVTTIAGQGASNHGYINGKGKSARFYYPRGMDWGPDGALYIADRENHRIRRMTLSGDVSLFAGSGLSGFADGKAFAARFYRPDDVAFGPDGRLYVADEDNNRVRVINTNVVKCNDGEPCTTDKCDPKTGACVYTAIKAGSACSDGDKCTLQDKCDAKGACIGKAKNCDDSNGCTDDSCNGVTGQCANVANTKPCDDGDKCTQGDICSSGKCIAGNGTVSQLAGSTSAGSIDGKATSARFSSPSGIGVLPTGDLVVADRSNHRLRRVKPDGVVNTWVGGAPGYVDGEPAKARFKSPLGLAVGRSGSVFVADQGNHRIRRVAPGGSVSTIAGSGQTGYLDGPPSSARFYSPAGLALAGNGDVYVADLSNQRIRLVKFGGNVITVAGSGTAGYLDGPVSSARFKFPQGLALDASGAVYVADANNHRIRRIALGNVTTVAGSGSAGHLDGAGSSARFHYPHDVAVDPLNDGILVTDRNNGRIRSIDKQGVVTTIAGIGLGHTNGPADKARLYYPYRIAVDRDANLYATTIHSVRKVVRAQVHCDDDSPCSADTCDKLTGTCNHAPQALGKNCSDGNACITGKTCDANGKCKGTAKSCNDGNVCTLDWCDPYAAKCGHENNRAACNDGDKCTVGEECFQGKCSLAHFFVKRIAGVSAGMSDNPGIAARFNRPVDVAVLDDNTAVIADSYNHRIRAVKTDGSVSTLAGGSAGFLDGPAKTARFRYPRGVSVLASGSVVVADTSNHMIREVDAFGAVKTVVGNVAAGFVDGPVAKARLRSPEDVVEVAGGSLAIADSGNHRIRRLVDGIVVTAAGSGQTGYVDGPGSSARFTYPRSLATNNGWLYFIDNYHSVRRVAPNGNVDTIAGGKTSNGFVDGVGLTARFNRPYGLAVSGDGRLWVADYGNRRIRVLDKLNSSAKVTTAVGSGINGLIGGPGGESPMYGPWGIAAGPDGAIWFSEIGTSHHIGRIGPKVVLCADGTGCTIDTCDKTTGKCAHKTKPAATGCDDGDGCTSGDACDKTGTCVGQVKKCNDGNQCTTDICDPGPGKCKAFHRTGSCDDGKGCTEGEVCTSGVCNGANGQVETFAGSTAGYADGKAQWARFNKPIAVTAHKSGLYVADYNNHRIRKIDANDNVTTVAGGAAGYLDGAAKQARFSYPLAVELDGPGTIYVFDRNNRRLRKIALDGTVTTLAGSGKAGYLDGPGASAQLHDVWSITAGTAGELHFVDTPLHRIRRLSSNGVVSTVAGSGKAGYLDGPASSAQFNMPHGIDRGPDGALYVADRNNHRIRRVHQGKVATIAGSGQAGFVDGFASSARFNLPFGIVVGPLGRIWISDYANRRIRRIDGNIVKTIAGSGANGVTDGPGSSASFSIMYSLSAGPKGHIYLAEHGHSVLRRIRNPERVCNDGNPCTIDSCNAKTGKCEAALAKDGHGCATDDKPCRVDRKCLGGSCDSGKALVCSDGDKCTKDACDPKAGGCVFTIDAAAGCKKVRRVFVSSQAYNGNLGGYTGADAKCQSLASSAGLKGTFQAWLTYNSYAPANRFKQATVPYVRTDGQQVAKDWSDLVDGTILRPIYLDENGKSVAKDAGGTCAGHIRVWTNTRVNGTVKDSYYRRQCNRWQTNTTSSSYSGELGYADASTSTWTQACKMRCHEFARLYCFEQTDALIKLP